MPKVFEAVYDNGLLRPLEVLPLTNGQHVQVTIAAGPDFDCDPSAFFDPEEWDASKHDPITLEEVHQALSSIRGSLAEAVIASRG